MRRRAKPCFLNRADAPYVSPAASGAGAGSSADADSWQPMSSERGDIARAMFYMDVRYDGVDPNTTNLVLEETVSHSSDMARLQTLIAWSHEDPVSVEERRRNALIDSNYQHNRNPFVDHPEYVDALYGNLVDSSHALPIPTNGQVTVNNGSMVVSWDPVPGATGYTAEVISNGYDKPAWMPVVTNGPNTSSTYHDPAVVPLEFRVKALNATSESWWAYIDAATPPPPVSPTATPTPTPTVLPTPTPTPVVVPTPTPTATPTPTVVPTPTPTRVPTPTATPPPSATPTPRPTPSPLYPGTAMVSAGRRHSVARDHAGAVWTWGDNAYGQLGDGTKNRRVYPAKAAGLEGGVVAVSAGGEHSLAVDSLGRVWAWGDNQYGQLGNGTLSTGAECWTPGLVKRGAATPDPLSQITAVAAGLSYSLALKGDGTVLSWGIGGSRLGLGPNGPNAPSPYPSPVVFAPDDDHPASVEPLRDVIAIATSPFTAYALKSDGTVWGWGDARSGALGQNNSSATSCAIKIGGLSGVRIVSISAALAGGHVLALDDQRNLWAWGSNYDNQSGTGYNYGYLATPARVKGPGGTSSLSNVVKMAAGDNFSVAVLQDGSVWAWGNNYNGALGNTAVANGPSYISPYPVQVMGVAGAGNLGGITAIGASSHVLAVHSAGDELSFYAWGPNSNGQLGDQNFPGDSGAPNGTTGIDSPAPVNIYLRRELSAPLSVAVSQHIYGPVVSWSPVSGASGYLVERGPVAASGAVMFSAITQGWPTTCFADATSKSGTTYQYRVLALNSGGQGLPSEAIAFSCPANAAYCHLAANDFRPSTSYSTSGGLDAVDRDGRSYQGAACALIRVDQSVGNFSPYANSISPQMAAVGSYGTDNTAGQRQDDGLIGARSVYFKGIDFHGFDHPSGTGVITQRNSPTGMVVQDPNGPMTIVGLGVPLLISVLELPLPGNTQFGISLWVNPASGGGGGALISNSYDRHDTSAPSNYRGLPGGFSLCLIQGEKSGEAGFRLSLGVSRADGTEISYDFNGPNDPFFLAQQWHHVVLSSSGSQALLFVDGQLAVARNVTILPSGLPLLLGNGQRSNRFYRQMPPGLSSNEGYRQAFCGNMDDIRVFATAPTEGVVADLASESIPQSLTTQVVGKRVSLSWKPSPQATSYTVLRATSANGPYSERKSTRSTAYTDATEDDNTVYFYRVRTNNPGFASLPPGDPGLYSTSSRGPLSAVIAAIVPPGNSGPTPPPAPSPTPYPPPSWPPPTPPPTPVEEPPTPCPDGVAKPNGGRVGGQGADVILLKLPLPPSDPPATGSFAITHSIVTYNTPRTRDLHGRLYVQTLAGDPSVISLTEGIHPGEYLDVVEEGHSDCGVHDWHSGVVPFGFKASHVGSVKLVFGVDPDPENPEGDGKPENSATVTICVADPKMAVDANRDGNIDLASDADQSTREKPYRFWLNDDNDTAYEPYPDAPPTEAETVPPLRPDHGLHAIVSKRNLEDFARLWIRLDGMQEAIVAGTIQVGLRWKTVDAGFPAINIYPSKDGAGSLSYLTDDGAAGDQTAGVFGAAVTDRSGQNTVNGTFIFKRDYWVGLKANNAKKCLLFEGAREGKGELELVFYDQEGKQIGAGGGVWLDLKNIKKMYERGVAGIQNPSIPYSYANNLPDPGISLIADPNAAQTFDKPWDETSQCIVLVHGFNVPYIQDMNMGETTLKRLWWRGYKGRFAVFRWPTLGNGTIFPPGGAIGNYNDSEYRAWHSGNALKQFVASLPYPNARNVMAHSMGNLVTGQAIRLGMDVRHYAMLHAATSASCYSNGNFQYQTSNLGVNTPDTDIDPPTRNLTYTGWLGQIAVAPINFRNTQDSVVGSIWNYNNNHFRPQSYNGDLPPDPLGHGTTGYFYDRSAASGQKLGIIYALSVGRLVNDHSEAKAYVNYSLTGAIGFNETAGGSISDYVDDSYFGDEHSAEWDWRIQKLKGFYNTILVKYGINPNP